MEDIIEKLARVLNVYWKLEPRTKEIIDGGKQFRSMRESKNITQTDVGYILGVSKQEVSRIESGKVSTVKSKELYQLAEAYGCTDDYLLGTSDTPDLTAPDERGIRFTKPIYFIRNSELAELIKTLNVDAKAQELFILIFQALHKASKDSKKQRFIMETLKNFVKYY